MTIASPHRDILSWYLHGRLTELEWLDGTAACRGASLDTFFSHDGERGPRMWDVARRICADCPLREPCREYAIVHEPYGFWGGTSGRERRQIRRQRGLRPLDQGGR